MSIGAAIYSQLSGASAVTAIVSGEIYADSSPANKYPLVLFSFTDATQNLLNSVPGTKTAMVVITGIATDYDTAHALADAIVAALNKQRGTWGGVTVQGCYHQPEDTEETTAQDSPQNKFYAIAQTFKLFTY